MFIRSLALKLTLAFLLVGVIGAILVAVLVGLRTRSEFDRFLSERDQTTLLTALGSYYTTNGSWKGVGEYLASTPPLDFYSRGIVLADARGTAVIGNRGYRPGQAVPPDILAGGKPIQVSGRTVGTVMIVPPASTASSANRPPAPEDNFLRSVTIAAATSAVVAALIALLLGFLLARTLTRPIRALTAATQAMAGGNLSQRVVVRSRDEIGELATSFNHMSADLSRASQLRKQMTADLAHDLRTPLSVLRGYTEGLKDGRLQGSEKIFTIMHAEVEHLQRLVEDLRVLSLADAGELPLNRRAVDPAALLERTGLAYFVAAEQQGVALRVEAEEGLPSVLVDTDRLTQVLNNLVSNALRHTPEGGSITLSASSEFKVLSSELTSSSAETQNSELKTQSSVVLRVRDTGSGIETEDLPFIFDRFYRADKARQRGSDNSSGLGLAIAKAIVEAHGGAIAVESGPGAGTTFTVELPAAEQHLDDGDGAAVQGERALAATHIG